MSEAAKIASMGITNLIELMQSRDEIKRLKEALAKQEQGKPVAWVNHGENRITRATGWDGYGALYTTPQQRTWVGLNWSDLPDEWVGNLFFKQGARWAETKLKEKNA